MTFFVKNRLEEKKKERGREEGKEGIERRRGGKWINEINRVIRT